MRPLAGLRALVLGVSFAAVVVALASLASSLLHRHAVSSAATGATGSITPYLSASTDTLSAVPAVVAGGSQWHAALIVGTAVAGILISLLAVAVSRERAARGAAQAAQQRSARELDQKLQTCLAELAAARNAVAQMSEKLDAARAEERVKIARDLHDDLSATLVALQIEMSAYNGIRPLGGQVRRRRAGADLVDGALDVVHKVVMNLRTNLDPESPWESIHNKARAYERATHIKCRVDIPEDLPQPPAAVASVAYRVIEEALTNVARHSGAANVDVRVTSTPECLAVTVTDDGCGIDEERIYTTDSYGLLGMRERAESVGGHVQVRRGPQRGTIVQLQVPHQPAYA